MEVILTIDVPKLGNAGDIVKVKSGFGRNYLIPQKLALPANTKNVHELEHNKRTIAAKDNKRKTQVEKVAEAINGKSVTIERTAGEEDKLFGSVTTRDIANALKKDGIAIDHRLIELVHPIKSIGEYDILIKLHSEVSATVKVWVVKE